MNIDLDTPTVDVTPNTEGLLRWLREAVAPFDKRTAHRVLRAGWPVLTYRQRRAILEGRYSFTANTLIVGE